VKGVAGPPDAEEQLLRLLDWRDRGNVYHKGSTSVDWTVLPHVFEPAAVLPLVGETPADWRKLWKDPQAALTDGRIRYQGGDVLARVIATPDQLRPEDFRLRPDSAGYRAGKDGKDLGADLDLVGPGPAYERWKKTRAYQKWRQDTGQLRADAAQPGPGAGDKRAVAVKVSGKHGGVGFILPGSHVDVVSFVRKGDKDTTQVIVQDALVLAVDLPEHRAKQPQPEVLSVTLVTTPEQAKKLDTAAKAGELRLLKRLPEHE
jgi:hypothetical protein